MLSWFSGYSRGLETEGSRVLGLLEPGSWLCVGAQVKDGSMSLFGQERTISMKLAYSKHIFLIAQETF